MLKEEKKKHKTHHIKYVYKKAYFPTNKTSATNQIRRYVFFEIQEIGRDPSMLKISYNLTKRKTKTEKLEKKMKMYINFKTIRYKLSASGNIVHSIFNYKLMRSVSNLRLPKEQKKGKTANSRKKLRTVPKAKSFQKKTSLIANLFPNNNGIFLFLTI